MTPQQATALKMICAAVVDVIKCAGDLGAPGGVLYAALMAHGCSLNQFESLMGAMVRAGVVQKRGDLYFANGSAKGRVA